MIQASCHCGAIRLTLDIAPPEFLTACNCSICHRLGVQWAYCKQGQVEIESAPDTLHIYRWQKETIEFCSCRHCGCTTHYVAVRKDPGGHFAVNGRAVEQGAFAAVPIRVFDGADTFRFLDD